MNTTPAHTSSPPFFLHDVTPFDRLALRLARQSSPSSWESHSVYRHLAENAQKSVALSTGGKIVAFASLSFDPESRQCALLEWSVARALDANSRLLAHTLLATNSAQQLGANTLHETLPRPKHLELSTGALLQQAPAAPHIFPELSWRLRAGAQALPDPDHDAIHITWALPRSWR